MQEIKKCPQCGSNRFKHLENNNYKCLYCGSTFVCNEPKNESKQEAAHEREYDIQESDNDGWKGEGCSWGKAYDASESNSNNDVKGARYAGCLIIVVLFFTIVAMISC